MITKNTKYFTILKSYFHFYFVMLYFFNMYVINSDGGQQGKDSLQEY